MEDLETVLPSGVQVTTLEPIRDKDGHITLRLRVLGPRDRSIQLYRRRLIFLAYPGSPQRNRRLAMVLTSGGDIDLALP